MTNQPGDLRNLLLLREGSLSAAQGTQLRERMVEDRVLRRRWTMISNTDPIAPAEFLVTEAVSPDTIAAFIDGTLDDETTARLEAACWTSPPLLREVAVLFKERHETAVRSSLTDRLLQLGPREAHPDPAIPLNGFGHHDPAAPMRSTPRPVTTAAPNRRPVFAAAAAITLAVALITWFALLATDDGAQQIVEDQPGDPNRVIVNKPDDPPTAPPRDPMPTPDHRVPDPIPSLGNPPEIVKDDPEKRIPIGTPPNPLPDQPGSKPQSITWEIEGVVAGRSRPNDVWSGVNARDFRPTATFATFPDSSARAVVGEDVTFVMDNDTQISRLAWDSELTVRLAHGRIAFENLKARSLVRFVIGKTTWEARAGVDKTSIAMQMIDNQPRLWVARGGAEFRNRRLGRNDVVSPGPDGFRVQRIRQDRVGRAEWSRSRISEEIRADLLRSPNLYAKINRLTANGTLPAETARLWQLTLSPERSIYRMLNHRDPAIRNQAMAWLIACPPDAPRTRRAWGSVLRGLNSANPGGDNPTLITEMQSWVRLLQTKTRPGRLYAQMVTRLEHRIPAVRSVAIMMLFRFTRRTYGYDPLAAPRSRTAAIKHWRNNLRAIAREF